MWKRVSVLWAVVKGDAKRLWFALQHPQAPGWLKGGTALLLLYLVSPLDLIPDVVPLFGIADDLVLIPAAIRWMLSKLPPEVRQWADRRASGKADDVPVVEEVKGGG